MRFYDGMGKDVTAMVGKLITDNETLELQLQEKTKEIEALKKQLTKASKSSPRRATKKGLNKH